MRGLVREAETDTAAARVTLIKTALAFKESDATFILKFAKDFSVGVYRISVGLFLPRVCCDQSCRIKKKQKTNQHLKNLSVSVRLVILPSLLPLPRHQTPTPVPTNRGFYFDHSLCNRFLFSFCIARRIS